jgi:hypothetical protein
MKQVVVHFDFPTVTQKQYDSVWDEIRASGNEHPKGLIFHVGSPKPSGGWMVNDVWESEEDFTNFGNMLMPMMMRQNIPMTPPTIMPVHFIYEGHAANAL